MDKLVNGIHHVSLRCRGYEEFKKTAAFYRDVLGLEVFKAWGEGDGSGIMLDTGCGIVEIFANAAEDLPQGAIRHFAFRTGDADACAERVRAAGYEITVEPKDVALGGDLPIRVCFCLGPVGEEIEFFCIK